MIRPILIVTLACTLVGGCKKPAATTTASAAPSVTEAPAAPAPVAATGIPTSEDFEQAASDEINPQNMETELEKLEKDIGR